MGYKIQGEVFLKGDKSLAHRYALFSLFTKEENTLENYPQGEDTLATLSTLSLLGAKIQKEGNIVYITPPSKISSPKKILQAKNSGTLARLLIGLLAGKEGIKAKIDGDSSLRKRPMQRVIEPLLKAGAEIKSQNGYLPVFIQGKKLKPISWEERLGSAQVKSALIFAALSSSQKAEIFEKKPSRDHTERFLKYIGVSIQKKGERILLLPPYHIPSFSISIPGDPSSASFLVVATLLAKEGSLRIKDILLNPFRSYYLKVLKRMKGRITTLSKEEYWGEEKGSLLIHPSSLEGTSILEEEIPSLIDEIPILSVAGVFARGTFLFRGGKELRYKESDRIKALYENLKNLGVRIYQEEDGLTILGNPHYKLQGRVSSFQDHRILMAMYILKLRAESQGGKVEIPKEELSWAKISFPEFFSTLEEILV